MTADASWLTVGGRVLRVATRLELGLGAERLAAIANLIGHDYPKSQADLLSVPRSWMLPLGTLLAAGALGLLAGLIAPVLGTAAAAGLVLYFAGALVAHLRVHDRHFGPWSLFFVLAVAALAVNLAYHGLRPVTSGRGSAGA